MKEKTKDLMKTKTYSLHWAIKLRKILTELIKWKERGHKLPTSWMKVRISKWIQQVCPENIMSHCILTSCTIYMKCANSFTDANDQTDSKRNWKSK